MSLANVLSGKYVDERLDDVFKSSAGPSTIAFAKATRTISTPQKRRAEEGLQEKGSKRPRGRAGDVNVTGTMHRERLRKGKEKAGSDADEREADDKQNELVSDDGEKDATTPAHETKQRDKRRKRVKKAKYTPQAESREQREGRTIFIGNLPVAIVKSKSLKKQLNRHILLYVPTAKVESTRFRSVAFRNPTSALEEDKSEVNSSRQDRELKRAAEWRSRQPGLDRPAKPDNETEEVEKDEKKYMAPAEKRRLAAIKGEIHEHSSATTNAYVVFAHSSPTSSEAEDVHAPTREVIDPFEAAREAVLKVNGTIFAEHALRVDRASKTVNPGQDLGSSAGALTDPRLSIFVGNLDFASSEDDVRAFFEKIMCEERGKPDDAKVVDDGDEVGKEQVARRSSWVTRVRLIRDRETQLGKGFAYVQFSDRDCVDEVLALEAEKLKCAKRILRVQRCKTLPATPPKPIKQQASGLPSHTTPKIRSRPGSIPLPKGDPTLGQRLAALPKEVRRKVKATDPARVARRLAKKKARLALEKTEKAGRRLLERKDKKTKHALNSRKKIE